METRWRIETKEGIAFSDNWIQRREEKKRVVKVAIRVEEMEKREDCVGTIGEGGERFNETIGGGEGGERDKQTIRVERGELERWRTIGEKRGENERGKITIERRGGMEDKCGKTAAAAGRSHADAPCLLGACLGTRALQQQHSFSPV